MFTGIITDIGTILARKTKGDVRFTIATIYPHETIALGASIAHNGVCLTVIEKGHNGTSNWFAVEASKETLDYTTAKNWQAGTRLNLERALKMGDELGGHLVSGHVDAVGTISSLVKEGDSLRLSVEVPEKLMRFMAEKGSVVIDGVSLTINRIESTMLEINIVPHTQYATILGGYHVGIMVNLEVDLLARYINRLMMFAV